MSFSKENSDGKTEWVKGPHLETHWQPQHHESPHRARKKADGSQLHSWWWASHISPKSSKWLQENLAEMDAKVNAMRKIIEEDADSFAKRAEMYYKRRPELVSLVEEFYRTYRALVERHTFLTKELRQNIAPALQAQLGGVVSPGNLPLKHGSDGFDNASLSSDSFPGVLEFGDYSQFEISAKSWEGHADEEDDSPQNEFGFQPFALSSAERLQLQHQNNKSDGFEDEVSFTELRTTVQILEEEKKALTAKSGEDEVKLKDLQSEVSSLISQTKALEAEEKLAKDRVNELLHVTQTLEAENLKLSHALITSKEEKTQLIEVRDRGLQEMLASRNRINELEEEITLFRQKTGAAGAEVLLGQEQVKQTANGDSLRQPMAVLLADVSKLEQDVSSLQGEKRILFGNMEVLELELEGAQREKEKLISQMKDRISELEEKEMEIKNLHEQLKAAKSGQVSLTENLSDAKNQWAGEQEKLPLELTQLKATSVEGQKNLVLHLESVNMLKTELLHMQQGKRKLEDQLSQVGSNLVDAERATLEAREELNKQITDRGLLNSEMAVVLSNLRKLERDLAGVQEEKHSLFRSLESTQREITSIRGENEHLLSQAKAATLQLQGRDSEIETLQEQLQAAERHNSSLAEALSSIMVSWSVQQDRLQADVAQLQATNVDGQKGLEIQLDHVSKIKEELTGLHGERSLLREDRDLLVKKLAEQLNQIEDARKREHEKDAELLQLSTLSETLRQSLHARGLENLKLREDLSKYAERHSELEKKFMDEISFLQSEELKWRNEVTTNSAFMAEKVASLRMENAALHEDLSLKLELQLKLEKVVESLTEERSSLSQALKAMTAEMQEYKNDLEIFKDIVIPSLEERADELQDEITDLTLSNERHVSEIVSLRKQLNDTTDELLCLHDENATLKIELMVNVEMLKHVDGVFSTVEAENVKLLDKLRLQEKHSQVQEQLLAKASFENEGLSSRLSIVTEERNGLKKKVQSLIAMLVEVERLQWDLAAARRGSGFAGVESSSIQKIYANESTIAQMQDSQNTPVNSEESVKAQMHQTASLRMLDLEHGSQMGSIEFQRQMEGLPMAGLEDVGKSVLGAPKEGNDGASQATAASHAHLIGMLKEEILYLQEEIQRLQLATAGQGSGVADNEVGAREFMLAAQEDLPSPRKDSTAFSSSILTAVEAEERLDDIQRLKEENCKLVEEINSLKSQSLAAWTENNLIENSVRDLQAKLALLQEQNEHLRSEVSSCKEEVGRLEGECHSLRVKNGHLGLEVSSCKADLERLGGECHSLREKNAEHEQDLRASIQCLHKDGSELIALIKTNMMMALEQVKVIIDECGKEIGDEVIVEIMKDTEHLCSSPGGHLSASLLDNKQDNAMENADQRRMQEAMSELEAQNMRILTELQARADETNVLLEFVLFIRKVLLRFVGGEHTSQRDALLRPINDNLEGGGEAGNSTEGSIPVINDEHHIKLAECLRQAFMDERLQHEFLELKEGRKQLKQELEVRLAEVQRMELELEKFQVLLEQEEHKKGGRKEREGEERRRNMRAEESAKELREVLAQQRRQISRIQEEVVFGEEQQEVAAENQVTILVSMESAPSMEVWDDEQVNLLSRELESLRGLNRRHSAELQRISQDLQSMGSVIKEAQDQLLLGSPQDEEEIIAMADLRAQKSSIIDFRTQKSSIIHLRSPENRVSIDSTQQLLSPSLQNFGEDTVAAQRSTSDGSTGHFGLKPRNFGFTWFLLLFSPDRKGARLARSKSKSPWAELMPIPKNSSGSTMLAVERGRRKTQGCWTCVSNTTRLDSFEER